MTRVGVMTFLHNDNYGSTLQAWALQTTLRELGFDAEHIDYAPSGTEKIFNLLRSGNSPALVLDGLRKRAVKAGQEGARRKSEAFRAFYAAHMRLSAVCGDHKALARTAEGYDVLVAGSDQVWSPVWLNPAYYLDFAGKKPRVAYAVSLGVTKMPEARKVRMIRRLAEPFDAVSVREEEGAEVIRQITDRRPSVMPDPVTLIGRETWLQLAEKPAEKCPYLLCYYIGRNSSYWEETKRLADSLGLDVVVLPVTEDDFAMPYHIADGATPEQWLGWIAGAAMVATDSFHGTLFSVILGRPVRVLRRYREDDPESKNSRIDQLLRRIGGTTDGVVRPSAQVDDCVEEMRREGREWLGQAVNAAAAK